MGSSVKEEGPWTSLNTYSSTDAFFPSSQWKPTRKLTKARCNWEMAVEVGAINLVPAIQFTNDVIDDTSFTSGQAIGTRQTATGVFPPTSWAAVATNAEANLHYRTGWLAKSVTDQTAANARVGGMWEFFFD